jgi:peptidoglycan/LPS O-acetylase OafA/YrhL
LSSSIAVKAFFIVSGFLIFMSYENTQNIKNYFFKRLRRIYPAYFVVIVLCVLVGAIFSTYSFSQYWSLDVLKYIISNLLFLNFLQPDLPGLFENNKIQAINGALWTLKIEVMFYCFVPLAVMAFNKFGRIRVLVTIYCLSILYSLLIFKLGDQSGSSLYQELQRQLPGQLTFFIAGALCYYYLEAFIKNSYILVVLAIFCLFLQDHLPWLLIEPLVLAVLVVYAACVLPYLGNFAKYGDFSYGVYITHFPILQILVSFGLFYTQPFFALGLASLVVLFISFFLWHLIEKQFLRKSSHYVSATAN